MTLLVHHAQDVESDALDDDAEVPAFEVTIDVHVLASAPAAPEGFIGRIAVPSGRLSIGDAEVAAVVDLDPGDWYVNVVGSPADYPDHVDIHIWPVPEAPRA